MGTVSTSLPSDGTTIDASDVNTPINAILSEFNGNIDDNNIKSGANINGSKLLASSIPGSKFDSSTQGGYTVGVLPAVSSVTENGNRSADITFASTVASILTPGMRIRTSRTVAAPTGAILLNGTTQYASKTTPSGMAGTNSYSFTIHARPTSYAIGIFASKFSSSGTNNGWNFYMNASGQITVEGHNAGNFRRWVSYQSLPLNKFSHVTARLDMSSTATSGVITIDGVDVPVTYTTTGSPATWVSAGNLLIGSNDTGGANWFPGNLAQCGVFSALISQATLRSYKNQTLSGSETSCIGAWKLDQASGLNDLNANANNLTATGSPTYSVASPFTTDANGVPAGTYDWAIVTKVATTVATVQYPEGCTIPTSGGISTVDYSGVKSPFGMPVSRGRWTVEALYCTVVSQATAATTSYNVQSARLTVPTGAMTLAFLGTIYITDTASSTDQVSTNLSYTAANLTPVTGKLTASATISTSGTTAGMFSRLYAEDDVEVSSGTIVYANIYTNQALDGAHWYTPISQVGGRALTIYCTPAYL